MFLRFLGMQVIFLNKIWEVFDYYFFKFSFSVLFLDSHQVFIATVDGDPQVSEGSVYLFYLLLYSSD